MDTLKRALMMEEGLRSEPYRCPAGALTIGYGHNLNANPLTDDDRDALGIDGDELRLSKSQSEALLVRDIARIVWPVGAEVFGELWATMGQIRRAAFGSMIYQLGPAGFRAFKVTIAHAMRRDWPASAAAALDSAWARQTPKRAARVAIAIGKNVDAWRRVR